MQSKDAGMASVQEQEDERKGAELATGLEKDISVLRQDADDHSDEVSTKSAGTLRGLPLILVIFSLCLAQFLSALDITIVATALPTIATQLHVSSAQYTWVGSAYNLASTSTTPLWARCSDIWGRKSMLLLANMMFMAGSLVAGLSKSSGMLIAGRTLQGSGGGGIVILVAIIIADLFPIQQRAKYYGFSALVWAVASALGPVLGGIFTQTIGWRWCFFINLPLDAISLVLLWVVLRIKIPVSGTLQGLREFDWAGSVAIVGGTICFLCGLEGGASSSHEWKSAYTLGLLLAGVASLAGFVLIELYIAKHPLIPVRVLTGRSCVAPISAACLHSLAFISYDYFLPLYFQIVHGKSPIISGVLLFASIIPLSFMSAATGIFIKNTGNYYWPGWFGSVFMTIGTGLFIDLNARFVLWKIIIYQFIAGIGCGPLFLSPMLALQNNLQPQHVASATSAFTFLRSISTSISIVIGGVVLQQGLRSTTLTSIEPEASPLYVGKSVSQRLELYAASLSNMWIFYTAVCGLMIIAAFAITKKKPTENDLPPSESCKENSEAS